MSEQKKDHLCSLYLNHLSNGALPDDAWDPLPDGKESLLSEHDLPGSSFDPDDSIVEEEDTDSGEETLPRPGQHSWQPIPTVFLASDAQPTDKDSPCNAIKVHTDIHSSSISQRQTHGRSPKHDPKYTADQDLTSAFAPGSIDKVPGFYKPSSTLCQVTEVVHVRMNRHTQSVQHLSKILDGSTC